MTRPRAVGCEVWRSVTASKLMWIDWQDKIPVRKYKYTAVILLVYSSSKTRTEPTLLVYGGVVPLPAAAARRRCPPPPPSHPGKTPAGSWYLRDGIKAHASCSGEGRRGSTTSAVL